MEYIGNFVKYIAGITLPMQLHSAHVFHISHFPSTFDSSQDLQDLLADDECEGREIPCSLHALQLKGAVVVMWGVGWCLGHLGINGFQK